MHDRRSFIDHCVAASGRLGYRNQDRDYLAEHEQRFYATWRLCRWLVTPGRSLLSIGAGGAFVESALAADGTEVTVVDFPEAMALMRPLLPPAERAFGPVSFENEGVHRREYMPSEIRSHSPTPDSGRSP